MRAAGHPLPLVLRADGTIEQVGTPGELLGVFEDPTLADAAGELRRGDSLILYTDGVAEPAGRPTDERLARMVPGLLGLSAEAMAEAIMAWSVRKIDPTRKDDAALLIVRAGP